MADLGPDLWNRLSINRVDGTELLRWLTGLEFPHGLEGIPAGLPLSWVIRLPLRTRTRNCLVRYLSDIEPSRVSSGVTIDELMEIRALGRLSLIDLLCVLESAEAVQPSAARHTYEVTRLDNAPLTTGEVQRGPRSGTVDSRMSDSQTAGSSEYSTFDWQNANGALRKLLTVSAEFHGARTLANALESDLGALMSALGLEDRFDQVPIARLVSGATMATEVLDSLQKFLAFLTPVERHVFDSRVAARDPLTLEEVGQQVSLTRERIRQIQKIVVSKWLHPSTDGCDTGWWLGAIAITLHQQLGPVPAVSDVERCLTSVFPDEGCSDTYRSSTIVMARGLLVRELGYRRSNDVYLDKSAVSAVETLKVEAISIADEVGLVDEENLRECLHDPKLREHWDVLVAQCALHRFSGRLGLRDTKKARVKAALLLIGRPATRKEVGEVSGIELARVGSHLSVIPGVVRADKERWGLEEWVDDEYDGIPGEIIQRIEEDGGATQLDRLVEELPRLFGVTESSVRSYVATPRFLLRDGYVSLADDSTITLRPLHDVVHGYTPDGRPIWRFKVEARYFDGYSLTGLPPEVVEALGCRPDGRTWVRVSSPAGCGPVSVGWPLASVAGTYVGYLAAPLRELGARPGDHALLVIDARESVSLYLATGDGGDRKETSAGDAASSDRGRDLLQRMKNRQRGL